MLGLGSQHNAQKNSRRGTRFDKMAESLGCYGEYVERPDEIRPALDRAQREVDRGSVALVNVKTDDRARAGTVAFAQYAT
jgi:thiamine pyrophosphate-dependent acetolactate synthase large subunit-like protein